MKVAIYVRVSTTEQVIDGYSIPAQINLLRQYCSGYQYEIYQVYQDQGISGKNIKDRPGLCELLDDAQNKKFDVVLVWKLSRLSRSLLDLLSVVDIFNKHSISFQSYSEKFDTSTPIGKMLLQLLGSIAEFERNTIIENVKMGMNERFKNGLSKGTIPFGYEYKDKQVYIVPSQAEAVKFAFNYYNDTTSNKATYDIVDYMNSKGYKSKLGNYWNNETVRLMLKNKFYAGYVKTGTRPHQCKGENYQEMLGIHESIISLELYESVNKKMEQLRRHPVLKCPENDCVLTGLIVCPKCGKRMYAAQQYRKYKKKNGEDVQYLLKFYRCMNSTTVMQCKGFGFSSYKIESKVLDKIFNINKSHIKKIIDIAHNKSQIKNKPVIDRLKAIDMELLEAIKIRDRYYKILETGEFNEDTINQFAKKINEVMIKIDQLEKRKEQEVLTKEDHVLNIDINKFIQNIKEAKQYYMKMTNEEKKRWLRTIIKEIHIDKDINLLEIVTIDGINLV